MVFHNNQYTFSLNRDGGDGCGFLEATRPLSAASLYGGDGGKVSRGTKSDIGVPCRRPQSSSSSSAATSSKRGHHSTRSHIPSVKSDFLLSYLNNSAYHISSGVSASTDYLENYKTNEQIHQQQQQQRLFSANSSSKLECKSSRGPYGHLQSKYHQQQQQQHHHTSERIKQRNHANYNASVANANIVGPLLYLDYVDRTMSGPQTPPRNQTTMQSVSRSYNNVNGACPTHYAHLKWAYIKWFCLFCLIEHVCLSHVHFFYRFSMCISMIFILFPVIAWVLLVAWRSITVFQIMFSFDSTVTHGVGIKDRYLLPPWDPVFRLLYFTVFQIAIVTYGFHICFLAARHWY